MILDVTDSSLDVRETDDFRRLHVEVPELPATGVVLAVLRDSNLVAAIDGTEILLHAHVLRQAAGSAHGSDWHSSFDVMLRYAATKGWYDETCGTIRVHCQARRPGDTANRP
nr:hypothetical protein GCM10017611_03860 [Rhodococcus wratislaviensis]